MGLEEALQEYEIDNLRRHQILNILSEGFKDGYTKAENNLKCCGNCKYEDEKILYNTIDDIENLICNKCKRANSSCIEDRWSSCL